MKNNSNLRFYPGDSVQNPETTIGPNAIGEVVKVEFYYINNRKEKTVSVTVRYRDFCQTYLAEYLSEQQL